MSIAKEVTFEDGVTPVTAAWLNLMQEMLAAYVAPNFTLETQSTTVLRVPAGDDHGSVAIAIGGQLRRRDTNATVTVTGGAGTKSVYATADSDDDLFALEVTSGTPSATLYRKIGEVDWDGAAITEVRPGFPLVPSSGPPVIAGVVPIGAMVPYTGVTSPDANFAICDGTPVLRASYPEYTALQEAQGFPFGPGDGSTTVGIPDMRGRSPIGLGAASPANVMGSAFGSLNHTHTNPSTSEAGNHSHTQGDTGSSGSHTHSNPNTSSAGSHSHTLTSGATSPTGSHSHSFTTGGPSGSAQNSGASVATAANLSHTHSGTTGSGGSHHHTIDTSMSSSGSHSHTQGSTGSSGSHTHSNPATGSAGAHTHTQGATGSNNHPSLVTTWLIRLA